MSRFTRRQILQILSMLLPASVIGLRHAGAQDAFDTELVCVHIYKPGFKIPEPLWKRPRSVPVRKDHPNLFNLEIPELIFCTKEKDFLSIFEYFWPIERSEFNGTLGKVRITFEIQKITGEHDVVEFSRYLENANAEIKKNIKNTAIIFTLNAFTRYFVADILDHWQTYGVDEIVVFKDPSKPPYLCSHPALQKGFKRPPPI